MVLIFGTILLDICFLFAVLIIVIIFYFIYSFQYWKRKNVPFISPSFPWGNASSLVEKKQNFGDFTSQIYRSARIKQENFMGAYLFTKPLLVLADPDLIKTVLVKDFNYFQGRGVYVNENKDPLNGHLVHLTGPKWKRLRKKLTPTFTSGKMKTMLYILIKKCDELQAIVQKSVDDNEPIDTKNILEKLTINNIGSCVFGLNFNCFKDQNSEFQKYGNMFFGSTMTNAFKVLVPMCYPNLLKMIGIPMIKKEVTEFFTNLFRDVIDERETSKIERKDFVDLFIKLKNNKTITDECVEEGEILKDNEKLTFIELAAQAFVFFAAGFETSATTINYCLFELAQSPEIQDKLREEIQEVLSKYNNDLCYDAVSEMTYLKQVINETLRKYPVIPLLGRECNENYKIPNTNVILDKGCQIWVPVLGLHYDPEYYPEPEVFNPERFSKENAASRHPCTYLPFGDGPRNCIGLRFGYLQVQIAIITLIRYFRYSLDPSLKLPIKFDNKGFLLASKGRLLLRAKKL